MGNPWCYKCHAYISGNLNRCNGCHQVGENWDDACENRPSKFQLSPYIIRDRKEIEKMIVTVIGSTKASREEMTACKNFFQRFGHEVHTPIDEGVQDRPLLAIQKLWIENICKSDLIVAIPKVRTSCFNAENKTYVEFGESTSYELAIADKFEKQVVYW